MITTDSYAAVRQRSLELTEPLEIEDFGIQPVADASPPKWHLAHTSWFFETFLLKALVPGYTPFNPAFEYLFNSYYNGVGEQFPRALRGTLSRPTVREVMAYRAHVDDAMATLLAMRSDDGEVSRRTILGLHHEQQHQELMLTDIKYNFGHNPLYPAYRETPPLTNDQPGPLRFTDYPGGLVSIGRDADADGFGFDCESPRHQVYLEPYRLADRLVTNAEYLAFVEAGGYSDSDLWLSDAWAALKTATARRLPLYWREIDGELYEYTLGGLQPLSPSAPVCHVSGFEADAYARWCGLRLPTEPEWEAAAPAIPAIGNFYESRRLHPTSETAEDRQFFGDAWEWTQTAYAAYPGFSPLPGALGEYNGKFMANQLVLRGGSCVTPVSHIRTTYRNFFYPTDQWQFSGIRLADNA